MSDLIPIADVRPGDRINHGGGYEVEVTYVRTYRTVTEVRGRIWGGTHMDVIRYDNAVRVTRLDPDEKLTAWGIVRSPPPHVPSGEQAHRESR